MAEITPALSEPSLAQRKALAMMAMRRRRAEAQAQVPAAEDTSSGAPLSVRAAVGSVPEQISQGAGPDLRLEAIRKTYPDAQATGDGNFVYSDPKTGKRTLYNPQGLDTGDLVSILPQIAEAVGGTGGAIAGGVAGAPGGPPGIAAGAMGGAGAGATLAREAVERGSLALQGIPDTRSVPEQMLNDLPTFALNAGGEGVGELAGMAGRGILKATMRGTGGRSEVTSSIADLARFGATPSVAQGTQNFLADATESLAAKFPGGAGVVRKAADEQQKAIAAAMATKLTNLAGIAPDELAAGGAITKGVEDFATNFTDQAQTLYKEVGKFLPPKTPVTVANTKSILEEVATPIKDAENFSKPLINPKLAQMLGGLNADLEHYGGDTLPYEALAGMRSKVGRELGSVTTLGPDAIPRAELKRVYAALTSDMRIAAQGQGPDAIKAFDRASAFYKAGMDKIDNFLEPLVKGRIPERVFAAVETTGKQGPTMLRELRNSVTPDQWRLIAATVADRLGRPPAGQRGEGEALFSLQKFLSGYQQLRDSGSADVLFNGPGMGGLKDDLDALARAADRTRVSSKSFNNPPNTASTLVGASMILAAVGSALTGNVAGLATVGGAAAGSYAVAKAMTNPKVVHWLAEGTRVAPNRMGAWIGRASAIAANSDPDTRDAIVGILGNLKAQDAAIPFTPPGGRAPNTYNETQIRQQGAAKRSEGTNPDGSIPGFKAGALDPAKAGNNWETIGIQQDGLNLTYVVPKGTTLQMFKKNPTRYYGTPFETDQAGEDFMRRATRTVH